MMAFWGYFVNHHNYSTLPCETLPVVPNVGKVLDSDGLGYGLAMAGER